MKKLILFLCSISFLFYCGCNDQQKEEGDNSHEENPQVYADPKNDGSAYDIIVKNIDDMAKKPWNKTVFLEIKDNQIPALKEASERSSAESYLEEQYSLLLIREANKILNDSCTGDDSHSILNNMLSELKSYPDVPGLEDLKALKKLHDEVDSFTNTAACNQVVKNFSTKYDERNECKQIGKAKEYLKNPKIKCVHIMKKLTKLTKRKAYVNRRKNYCNQVTALYLKSKDGRKDYYDLAKGNIDIKYVPDDFKGKLWKQMEKHYNELKGVSK